MIAAKTAANFISDEIEALRPVLENAIQNYCNERDWQKLRPDEMAAICASECAVAMTQLVISLRDEIEKVVA